MDTVTLEEMLEVFKEHTETELEGEGLATWSISTSGQNFVDNFQHYSTEDLKDLRGELKEGAKAEITIDFSVHILDHLNEILADREEAEFPDEDEFEV